MTCADQETKFHSFGTALRVLTESGLTKEKFRWYWCISHCDHEHATFQEAVECPDVEMPEGYEGRKGEPIIQEWITHDHFCDCKDPQSPPSLPRQFIREMVDDMKRGKMPDPSVIETLVDFVLIQESRIEYLTEELRRYQKQDGQV